MNNHESVLKVLGINDYHETKDEFIACCIFCGEAKYNLQINFKKKLYHCWVCNEGGSIIKLIHSVTGFTSEEANRLFRLDEIDVDKALEEISENLTKTKERFGYIHFTDNNDRYKYWEERGIEYDIVNKLRLGFDEYTNRMVIPIFDENHVCSGLVRRAVTKEQEPKYLYNKGFDRNNLIYNLTRDDVESHVEIVEGHIDAIKLYQMGYNPICIMGTDLSKYAFNYVSENFDRVFLMLDNDEPGKRASEKIAERFYKEGMQVWQVEYATNDPGDLIHKSQILNSRKYNLSDF